MKYILAFFLPQKSKRLFGFIFLLIMQNVIFANGSDLDISAFHCDELDWSKMSIYAQTHNEELRICLLNDLKNQGERCQKATYDCRFYTAQSYYYQTDYKNCGIQAQKALSNTKKSKDSTLTLLLLSRNARANDRVSVAQDHTLQALDIARRKSLSEETAYAHIELARIHYTLNDSLKAVEHLSRAKDIVENAKDPNLKGEYTYQKARVQYWYEGETNIEEIIAQLLESLSYFEAADNYVQVATALDFMGICYSNQKKYSKSQECYKRALGIKTILGNYYGQAVSYNNLAYMNYVQSDVLEAIKYFKKSGELSEKANAFELLKQTYSNIAVMYELIDYPDSTVAYFRKTMAVMDTLKLRQRTELVYDLQTQYETREKEQQIKVQKQQLSYLGFSAGLLALVAGLIYFLYRQKSRLNTIITGQKEELEKLNSFKNQLFSIMGHDLRGMMSKLNISQRKMVRTQAKQGDENMKAPVSKMGAIIDGLNGFIENILYWGFTQTNRLHFTYQDLNVDSVVEQVAYNFKYDLEHKNITLKKDLPDDFCVHADLNTTKVVIRNLLANAIKYSDADGEITIRGIIGEQDRLIQVIDQGQGIPPEKIPILFAVSNEKVTSGTAGEKGTGLGLWLCKEMMEKNKGTIEVESQVGKGTIFTLRFLE